MAIKKLIAMTVSSRETGQRRTDEGKTTSSQMHTATQVNQSSDRGTSEGCGREKLKKVDGDFPACMRRKKDNNDDNTKKDLKGKGGGRLKHYNVDGEVPPCLRKREEKSKYGSSSNEKNSKEKNESGSSTLNRMKDGSKSKMTSGSKDLCGDTTEKKNNENGKTKSKDIAIIVLQKNMRSMHSSETIEEMVCELDGYRWDAILMSVPWRSEKSEIWETHHKHIFVGAGKYDNKHGV